MHRGDKITSEIRLARIFPISLLSLSRANFSSVHRGNRNLIPYENISITSLFVVPTSHPAALQRKYLWMRRPQYPKQASKEPLKMQWACPSFPFSAANIPVVTRHNLAARASGPLLTTMKTPSYAYCKKQAQGGYSHKVTPMPMCWAGLCLSFGAPPFRFHSPAEEILIKHFSVFFIQLYKLLP